MTVAKLPALAAAGLIALMAPAFAQTAPATPPQSATGMPQQPPAADTGAPVVGGAPMLPTRTIVENASAASTLTTLVTAVKAADLVATLSGPGPFTVFAPTNDAFGRLAPGVVDALLKPANKEALKKVLTYHVVAGEVTLEKLDEMVTTGGGKAVLTSVAGQPITVERQGPAIKLTDVSGNTSYIELADVKQSNGYVHVVNGVLVPKLK
ncbi:fasciclin domain-containing protein [Sphingomonas sp.]|uniref:fasciclin domain-containing protein n=1 Tax=Sphingomonas sp. TaxID=28214 RepID=UPI001DDC84A3|nr:fasciclin domain-containing protein [Sphingomonas sp.]MBX9795794.1 fasciclin domain-containing protein [Sphingomonas sp.]